MPLRLPPLRGGHGLRLLEGSRELFPALIAAIEQAKREVRLETYIFDFTGASSEVAYALERAARRGVAVQVVVDGFGTPGVPPDWAHRFEQAGVAWQVYAPVGSLGVLWPGSWRRLHRKLCVVDGTMAFCGGINILDDLHDPNHGTLEAPRFDFAVQVTGPLVAEVHAATQQLWQRLRARHSLRGQALSGALFPPRPTAVPPWPQDPAPAAEQRARAALLLRDNLRYRARIERAYRRAIGRAQSEIIIANAYFVPGRKLREALASAARRGVQVKLLLQGRYEYFMQYYAARPIYGALLQAGVAIHEYSPSFLHAKVAVIDARWATVGSSNLDPLSLLLAREANVVVEDAPFALQLRQRLLQAIGDPAAAMDPAQYGTRPLRQRVLEGLALGVMRLALAVQGKRYL
ncbi:cardiolipin synthase ClsB [Ramlibacter tataouinensis]|uniref:Cardiolipin synthase B n=1 Tax=Ramlibacter tataouinensis (strain ATCC BAA-407 / DSM 14655 / LMG 21543 / TTB310) TaxID=365046 RepID=F5XWS7_RAMTT|nr:cardiolipin synthase ClsB [Ramlibacter tataouinensis]AEG94221.1 cardiolipin synthetase (Cardiolipin synthase)-like protein [Ramlibacter tataouinensis TTB310]